MDRVAEIAESIRDLGLMNAPAVCIRDNVTLDDGEMSDRVPVLIYGRHRLLALEANGEASVECVVYDVDDLHAELMEIAENLHRSELTALQRDEQVARWIELTSARRSLAEGDVLSRQADAKPGRPEGGVRAASRELGLSEADARRAVKVASLSGEAKQAAADAGLADNRTALLAAAREEGPDKQVAAIKGWDARREMEAAKASLARKKMAVPSDSEFGAFDGIREEVHAEYEYLIFELHAEVEVLKKKLAKAKGEISALRRKPVT
ncbi:ParB/RepB/Spo0J family partition protein [Aurantimonas sp. C2-5-R2]|uniref:ParB/RepB/Spo0J family partition protein n=1 Tax=Aurantimonas sp. C2-5-R2 TaxID=3113713 RepID=UPI003FA55406